jgi:hypothetical protein
MGLVADAALASGGNEHGVIPKVCISADIRIQV